MAVNPLILDKINRLDVHDVIKQAIRDILTAEDNIGLIGAKSTAVSSIEQILEKCAKSQEIVERCDNHE